MFRASETGYVQAILAVAAGLVCNHAWYSYEHRAAEHSPIIFLGKKHAIPFYYVKSVSVTSMPSL